MAILLSMLILMAEPAPPDPLPPHNFLKQAAPRRPCGQPAANGDIVVCAREEADEQYRLRPLADADRYDQKPLRAETRVFGGGKLAAHTEGANVGGFTSNRAMVTLSFPF